MALFDRSHVHEFLLAVRTNYGPVLYHFRDKARYWLKIAIFSYPLHSTAPLGDYSSDSIQFNLFQWQARSQPMDRIYSLHCVSKNAPTLASCSFFKHGLILIIFGKLHQHTFKNDMRFQLSLILHFTYFICF